jgi:hypothetical protein
MRSIHLYYSNLIRLYVYAIANFRLLLQFENVWAWNAGK